MQFQKILTKYGEFLGSVYLEGNKEHLVLIHGDINPGSPVLVRIHSECLTGDVFGSRRCDCQLQLEKSIKLIFKARGGVLLYLRQEGRGIGLANKLKAYALQDKGLDTVDANLQLGFEADLRNYSVACDVLEQLGLKQLKLLTNNPQKLQSLKDRGFDVERVPLIVEPDMNFQQYLRTKQSKLGHIF